jgi:hypothetical protein
LFFQIYLENFGNFNKFRLSKPIDLRALLDLHRKSELTESQVQNTEFDDSWIDGLRKLGGSLDSYFSIEFSPQTCEIRTLPVLIQGHTPNLNLLPIFVSNFQRVQWNDDKLLLYSFGQILSDFYSFPIDDMTKMREITELYVYPKLKTFLKPSPEMNDISRKLTETSDLYRVFERC